MSRIPKPPAEDVLKSAIGIPTEGYLHQLHFYYPIEGGFEALVHAFAARVTGAIKTSWAVSSVTREDGSWIVESTLGERREYETLVSTLPIHELLRVWPAAPAEAIEVASNLRYNSLINVMIGTSEDRGYPYTALYVPDPDVIFHRLSFPKAFSERCVPDGSSSIMAEITANAGDGVWEMSDETIIERTLADVERLGFLDRSTLNYSRVVRFNYGYPVYDLNYRSNVTRLRELVEAEGIHLLGRFAQFDYINSDVCVERALLLAGELRDE